MNTIPTNQQPLQPTLSKVLLTRQMLTSFTDYTLRSLARVKFGKAVSEKLDRECLLDLLAASLD